MQTHARVAVVGGGCVGASILYGLVKRGWRDVILLERTQLTAGSTWHAAGLIPCYARSLTVGKMVKKTIEIYEGLEAETGQNVGWHKCGQLRIANTQERLDEYRSYMGMAEVQGWRAELLSPTEVRQLWPLLENNQMLGALYHPDDGHIAPADVTMALAKGARDGGAKIYQNCEVISFERQREGTWKLNTKQGESIIAEHIVLATGNYARQTGAMLGLDLPAIPIIHQYWTTDSVPEIVERKAQGLPEMPILRDESVPGYIREEGDGLMFGPYERTENLKLFAENGVPEWFGADLLEEDFDAVSWHWEKGIERVPALGKVGIKANVRGPFQMTPDEMPLVGPAWGLNNVWLAEGIPGGIFWGGSIGYYLSERIVEGANSLDMSELDPRRFGDYANKNWAKERIREAWGTHADLRFPDQPMKASRPQKTAPSYERLNQHGAIWSVLGSWEVPQWFAPKGVEAKEQLSWRWADKRRFIGEEVAAVRNDVGLVEMTAMTKFEISGSGAAEWLDFVLANKLPKCGRALLSHHLTAHGGVRAEYVVSRLENDLFYLISTPSAERLNFDELSKLLPSDGSVTLRNASQERGCFTVVGPKARELLQPLTELDLSNAAFPWFGAKSATVGLASDVRILRVNYEGELGFELYHPIAYQRSLLDALLEQGKTHGLRLIGYQALESMRLDKSYRAMYRDMNEALSAWESGLDRFIQLDKGNFIGKSALEEEKKRGISRRIVTLAVETDGASTIINEAVYCKGTLVGRITSGAYSYTFGHDIALALIEAEFTSIGTEFEIPVLGKRRKARIIEESPYDPTAARARL